MSRYSRPTQIVIDGFDLSGFVVDWQVSIERDTRDLRTFAGTPRPFVTGDDTVEIKLVLRGVTYGVGPDGRAGFARPQQPLAGERVAVIPAPNAPRLLGSGDEL